MTAHKWETAQFDWESPFGFNPYSTLGIAPLLARAYVTVDSALEKWGLGGLERMTTSVTQLLSLDLNMNRNGTAVVSRGNRSDFATDKFWTAKEILIVAADSDGLLSILVAVLAVLLGIYLLRRRRQPDRDI